MGKGKKISTLPKTNFNFSVTFILSSVNPFNLDQSKHLSFGEEFRFLTVKHTITIFNNQREKAFGNIVEFGETMVISIFSFSHF